MNEFPRALRLGDLVALDLPSGEVLALQVRSDDIEQVAVVGRLHDVHGSTTAVSSEAPWFRVLGLLDSDLEFVVARTEVTSARIYATLQSRREANARVIANLPVPTGSLGVPKSYRPGMGLIGPGERGKGYILETPGIPPMFVPELTDDHRRDYVFPAVQHWEDVPSLHENDWDNVRAYEARCAAAEVLDAGGR